MGGRVGARCGCSTQLPNDSLLCTHLSPPPTPTTHRPQGAKVVSADAGRGAAARQHTQHRPAAGVQQGRAGGAHVCAAARPPCQAVVGGSRSGSAVASSVNAVRSWCWQRRAAC